MGLTIPKTIPKGQRSMYALWLESVVAISPLSAAVAHAAVSSNEAAASVISKPLHPPELVVSPYSRPAYSPSRSLNSAAARRKITRRSMTEVCTEGGSAHASEVGEEELTSRHPGNAFSADSITLTTSASVTELTVWSTLDGAWGSTTS